jgi:hypothetical protein
MPRQQQQQQQQQRKQQQRQQHKRQENTALTMMSMPPVYPGGGPSVSPWRPTAQQQHPHHSTVQQQGAAATEHHQEPERTPVSRSENALSWFLRSRQQRKQERQLVQTAKPTDPASAAWAFFRCGTGIPFVDESLRLCQHYQNHNYHYQQQQHHQQQFAHRLPVLEIRDDKGKTGKTRTLLSLAARFVVSTRPSLFSNNATNKDTTTSSTGTTEQAVSPPPPPQVIVLDSTLDMTPLKLAYAVSSQLLRQYNPETSSASSSPSTPNGGAHYGNHDKQHNDETMTSSLEQEIQACLSRIQMVHVDDMTEWVPVLESLCWDLSQAQRHEPSSQQQPVQRRSEHSNSSMIPTVPATATPTLLLWDGFLSEPTRDVAGSRMEVIRQLTRLLQECPNVGLMYTRTSEQHNHHNHPGMSLLRSLEAQVVRLDREETDGRHHEFVATVLTAAAAAGGGGGGGSSNPQNVHFSLSAAGVLR